MKNLLAENMVRFGTKNLAKQNLLEGLPNTFFSDASKWLKELGWKISTANGKYELFAEKSTEDTETAPRYFQITSQQDGSLSFASSWLQYNPEKKEYYIGRIIKNVSIQPIKNETEFKKQISKLTDKKIQEQFAGSGEPKSPFPTTRIGNLEVYNEDLGKMSWDDAMKKASELGEGWRLPTLEELRFSIYPNRYKIPNLEEKYYWSSSEYDDSLAWSLSFSSMVEAYDRKTWLRRARAVRNI